MLTTEEILDAAEEVLRRFGPQKTTVIDIARELNVSHGTVYRHFKSKAKLHGAITKRWLEKITAPLSNIASNSINPRLKLRKWFEALMKIKMRSSIEDPEMFASYSILVKGLPEEVVFEHLQILIKQVENILLEGVKSEEFDIKDCTNTARTLFFATIRYHHPLHVKEWKNTNIEQEFEQLFNLLEKAICI